MPVAGLAFLPILMGLPPILLGQRHRRVRYWQIEYGKTGGNFRCPRSPATKGFRH